jgi:hypothetical protein
MEGIVSPTPPPYRLRIVPEVHEWLRTLRAIDRQASRWVAEALGALIERGPALGRPLVDTLSQGKKPTYPNLKELRPHSGHESAPRILFIFDPDRNAVLLVAGDKAGNWAQWYREMIPLAIERYEDYVKKAEADGE